MSMSHEEMIAVIQAHKDGRTIQRSATDAGIKLCKLLASFQNEELDGLIALDERWPERDLRSWHDNLAGTYNFTHWNYRIKPTPTKPREWWICYDTDPVLDDSATICSVRQSEPLRSLIRKQIHVREVLPEEEGA